MLYVHENPCFSLGFFRLREMNVHLISIEISVVWGANAFIESESSVRHYLCSMSHDGDSMQTGLSIKKNHITIFEVPLHDISDPYLLSNLLPVCILQEYLSPISLLNIVCPWMNLRTILDQALKSVNVVLSDSFRISEILGNVYRNHHLINGTVGIR